LKLDLQKIARVRRKNIARTSTMDYLISRIRRELEDRMAQGNTGFDDSLVIDFINGDLGQDNLGKVNLCSLLEVDFPGIGVLKSYPEQSMDCIVINLQLSWLDFQVLIPIVSRLLRPGGTLFFSAFGPDTLQEVYASWAKVDDLPHVHPFVDMHHLGDELLRAGFIQPIVDADWVFVDYPKIELLFEDLKQEGFTNIISQRRKTLTGVRRFRKFSKEVIQVAKNGNNFNITFELIYGYAKMPDQSDAGVRVNPPALDSL